RGGVREGVRCEGFVHEHDPLVRRSAAGPAKRRRSAGRLVRLIPRATWPHPWRRCPGRWTTMDMGAGWQCSRWRCSRWRWRTIVRWQRIAGDGDEAVDVDHRPRSHGVELLLQRCWRARDSRRGDRGLAGMANHRDTPQALVPILVQDALESLTSRRSLVRELAPDGEEQPTALCGRHLRPDTLNVEPALECSRQQCEAD